MKYEISGTVMQTVSIDLAPGEQIYSQTSQMAWMSDGIQMDTNMGGVWAGIKRSLTGGGLFITDFTAEKEAQISFAARFPGTIKAIKLEAGKSIICRKETFLIAEKSVTIDVAWQKRVGAGLFAGQGFVLQRITGPGIVWLDLSGEVVTKDLAAGERLLVHAGHIGVQSPSVTVDITRVRGFSNILFGGQGFFLATLTGPGHVMLQSMPIINLAEEIARYLPQPTQTTQVVDGSSE